MYTVQINTHQCLTNRKKYRKYFTFDYADTKQCIVIRMFHILRTLISPGRLLLRPIRLCPVISQLIFKRSSRVEWWEWDFTSSCSIKAIHCIIWRIIFFSRSLGILVCLPTQRCDVPEDDWIISHFEVLRHGFFLLLHRSGMGEQNDKITIFQFCRNCSIEHIHNYSLCPINWNIYLRTQMSFSLVNPFLQRHSYPSSLSWHTSFSPHTRALAKHSFMSEKQKKSTKWK